MPRGIFCVLFIHAHSAAVRQTDNAWIGHRLHYHAYAIFLLLNTSEVYWLKVGRKKKKITFPHKMIISSFGIPDSCSLMYQIPGRYLIMYLVHLITNLIHSWYFSARAQRKIKVTRFCSLAGI